jgi:SAM-dependent methyltransferase
MIDEARRRHAAGGAHLRFARAPADGLGVADATFDALRADRVLLHVPDPAAAVREAVRVVRPGGRIVISEPDMASVWTATRLPEVGEAILRAVALSVAHPLVARDLVDLFLEAGLEHLHLELRPLVINDPEPGERILNFSAVAERLVAEGRLSADAAQQWLAELAERKRTGRFLGGMTIFIVAASKPV